MKPFYAKATTHFDNSVTIRYIEKDDFHPIWHYHDEYELVYIHSGTGMRYVGDSIIPFSQGDFVLLGSKLPHMWMNKEGNEDGTKKYEDVAATVIHFQPKFIHNSFFELPMMKKIKDLFGQSTRGIRFTDFPDIEIFLNNLHNLTQTNMVVRILELLAAMCDYEKTTYISSHEYGSMISAQYNERFARIHHYLAIHFKEKINLNTLADLANMTPPAFCTYFKNKTTKTVFTYINDLKIGYSCRLLLETTLTIDQIGHQSGYNSITFYNRKFKEKMKLTPKAYRKKFRLST